MTTYAVAQKTGFKIVLDPANKAAALADWWASEEEWDNVTIDEGVVWDLIVDTLSCGRPVSHEDRVWLMEQGVYLQDCRPHFTSKGPYAVKVKEILASPRAEDFIDRVKEQAWEQALVLPANTPPLALLDALECVSHGSGLSLVETVLWEARQDED